MCFSAGASFAAAAVLGTIGSFSIKRAEGRSQIMFASIPMLFAVQQFSEGLLWLSLSKDGYEEWQTAATYFFLFFAQFLWTTWIPVSMLLMETHKTRKKILSFLSLAGIADSLLLGYRLVFYNVHAEVQEHHIFYNIESPQFIITLSSILYVIAIILPAYFLSIKQARPLAIMLTVSLIVTKLFYSAYLISVWCFFAATLSIIILWIIKTVNTKSAANTRLLHHKLHNSLNNSH